MLFAQIRNKIKHNNLCIKISRILKWDDFKSYINKRIIQHKMKKNQNIFESPLMRSIMYLPYFLNDDIQSTIIRTKNYYDIAALDFICKKWNNGKIGKELYGSSFIDVGSNIGNHSLYLFNECHASSSYNFEPIKDTFEILIKNISLNKLSNKAHLYNVALGSQNGKASLSYYDPRNIGMAQIINDNNGNFQVIALDNLDIQDNIKFVKIDVEGFELNVIQGMKETIKKYRPYIMIEIRHTLFDEINSILKKIGYDKIEINRNSELCNCLYFSREK